MKKFGIFTLTVLSAVMLYSMSVNADLIFEENFEDANWADRWSGSNATTTEKSLSGNTSLYWVKNTIHEKDGITSGNYVYEMWFYDVVQTEGENGVGALMFGTEYTDGGVAQIGFKSNAWGGLYIYGHNSGGDDVQTTGVKRSPGWHQMIVDLSQAPKAVFYIDGVKTNEKSISQAIENIGVQLKNPWFDGVGYYIDDIRVWESIEDVPPYHNGDIITDYDNTSIPIASPEFTVQFAMDMDTSTYSDAVVLKEKNSDITVEFDITDVSETGFKIIPKSELKYETEYVLTVSDSARTKQFNSKLPKILELDFTTEKNPFQILSYGFYDDGGNLVTEYKDGKYTLKASFENKQDLPVGVNLVCVLYEIVNGIPRHVSASTDYTILGNEQNEVTLATDTMEIKSDGEYILKGFLWSGFSNRTSLREMIEIKK